MSEALFIARLVLAATFGVAGVAKLFARGPTTGALHDFGVPARLVRPAAVVLPIAEVAVAVALLLPVSARLGAGGAGVLLAAFSAAVVRNLVNGRRPDCRCFGQVRPSPIGWRTLARNAVLAASALAVVAGGPGHMPAFLGTGSVADRVQLGLLGVALILVAGLTWVVLHLWMQQGVLMRRLGEVEARAGNDVVDPTVLSREPRFGLSAGAAAPDLELRSLAGERTPLCRAWGNGKPALMIFVSPQCRPCVRILDEVGTWQRDHIELAEVVVISLGDVAANEAMADAHGLISVLLQDELEVQEAYKIPGTPAAVAVGSDGRVASAVAAGPQAVRSLAAATFERASGALPDHAVLSAPDGSGVPARQ